jgi:hypothetical protein
MAELPDQIFEQISLDCELGNELMDGGRYREALGRFSAAWEALPEPRTTWEAATWILGSIADTHFFLANFEAMREPLMMAMQCESATGNPFLRLRLGQCLFELGEKDEAANWLGGVYLQEGAELFGTDDPKYLEFVKTRLSPPPGGWPGGW